MSDLLIITGRAQSLKGALGPNRQWLQAAKEGGIPAMRGALAMGADVNAQDKHGYTALHWAVINGNEDAMRFLIQQENLDPNVADHRGDTPFLKAFDCLSEAGVYYTKKAGADVTVRNKAGHGPLYKASRQKAASLNFLKLAHAHDDNIDFVDKEGNGILLNALAQRSLDKLQYFLFAGASPFIKGQNGKKNIHELALQAGMGVWAVVVKSFLDMRPLTEDISHLTTEVLTAATLTNGRSFLDNPLVWRRMPEIIQHLRANGEPLPTKAQLLAQTGVPDINMRSASPALLALRGNKWECLKEMMAFHGESITADDFWDDTHTEISTFGKQAIHNGILQKLFSYEEWQGKSLHELKSYYYALPEDAQNAVKNYQQLKIQLRNDDRQQAMQR